MELRGFYVNVKRTSATKATRYSLHLMSTNYELQDYLLPSNEGLPFKGKDRVI
jgi:hypothetical protein